MGIWRNIKFKDPVTNTVFSDGLGNVVNPLDFGNVTAGEITAVKEILIVNELDYPVKNVRVWVDGGLPAEDEFQMSFANNPFISEALPLVVNGTHGARSNIRKIHVRIKVGDNSQGASSVILKASADPA